MVTGVPYGVATAFCRERHSDRVPRPVRLARQVRQVRQVRQAAAGHRRRQP